jgi:hypothetical protein
MGLIPLVAALLAVAADTAAQPRGAQPLPAGTSALRGTLTDALSNEPVANCEVRAALTAATRASAVTTGADGSFEFAGIPEGSYFLMIRCPSHLTTCIQSKEAGTAPCSTITLFRDQQRNDLDFRLTPGAVARGRVLNGAGKPVANAIVRLGGPLSDRPLITLQGVTTKADGTFDLPNLPDGAWRLEVEIPPMPGTPRVPIVYYPGVLSREEAGAIEFVAGHVKDNLTISIPRSLESTVTVRVPPPDGTMTMAVSIIRAEPLMTQPLQLDADGQAVIRGLVAGRYFVTLTATSGPHRFADYLAVNFAGDSVDVSLQLQPVGRIRGRIVSNGGSLPPLAGATVGAVWIDEDVVLNPMVPEESPVAADGTFEINGLFGRRRLQLIRFDPDWRIQAVLHGKTDVTALGIDVAPNSTADVTISVGRR